MIALLLGFAFADAGKVEPREWKVGDDTRQALVYTPAKPEGAPLVFAWHGHGGAMKGASNQMHIHTVWPEAVVVYPQGLNTPGRLTDPEGKKPGWQSAVGDQKDRDLKFFDAMLKAMKDEVKVDPKRIYSTGHSNGGGFTYLLWVARGDAFAAFAPVAAAGSKDMLTAKFPPRPVIHFAGENDPLVKFPMQRTAMDFVRKHNECEDRGRAWDEKALIYDSKKGAPLVEVIHAGKHEYPKDAPPLIAKFFKEHKLP